MEYEYQIEWTSNEGLPYLSHIFTDESKANKWFSDMERNPADSYKKMRLLRRPASRWETIRTFDKEG